MNDAIESAYRQICTEIDKLQAVKTAMEHAMNRTGTGSRQSPVTPRTRAPKGALEAAIKAALATKGGLVNREIRARLLKASYPHSLTPLHVGKTLSRMVDDKELKLDHVGHRVEYSIK